MSSTDIGGMHTLYTGRRVFWAICILSVCGVTVTQCCLNIGLPRCDLQPNCIKSRLWVSFLCEPPILKKMQGMDVKTSNLNQLAVVTLVVCCFALLESQKEKLLPPLLSGTEATCGRSLLHLVAEPQIFPSWGVWIGGSWEIFDCRCKWKQEVAACLSPLRLQRLKFKWGATETWSRGNVPGDSWGGCGQIPTSCCFACTSNLLGLRGRPYLVHSSFSRRYTLHQWSRHPYIWLACIIQLTQQHLIK